MKTISNRFYGMGSQIAHFAGIPLFYFIFTRVYSPLKLQEYLAMGRDLLDFNLTITTVICLLVLTGTRLLLYFLKGRLSLTTTSYVGYCIAETLLCSGFCALFLALMKQDEPYFQVLGKTLIDFALIFIFPYIIFGSAIVLGGLDGTKTPAKGEDSLLRFLDDQQRLKLAIAPDAVLFIEAKYNYVEIHYTDAGRLKSFMLRSSMKRLEDMLSEHSLVRCHRTYFVNPLHVKVLRREKNGAIVAELDSADCLPIPVSKTYYDNLSKCI